VDDTHAAEGGELIAIAKMDIDAGGAGILAQQVGFANAREERMGKGVGERVITFDVGRFGEVHTRLTRHPILDLREPSDMIDVEVGNEDILDVLGGAAQFFDGLQDTGAGPGPAGINQGDVIVDDEIGAGAASSDLV
jgi:hypothetical protein